MWSPTWTWSTEAVPCPTMISCTFWGSDIRPSRIFTRPPLTPWNCVPLDVEPAPWPMSM